MIGPTNTAIGFIPNADGIRHPFRPTPPDNEQEVNNDLSREGKRIVGRDSPEGGKKLLRSFRATSEIWKKLEIYFLAQVFIILTMRLRR